MTIATTYRLRAFGGIVLGLILAAMTSQAAITDTALSSDFDYKYEMTTDPTAQDLDSNSTVDWFAGIAGGATAPNTYSGGAAYSDQGAATPEILFRTDFGGSITRAEFPDTARCTFEIRVTKTGGAQGTIGWFGMALQMVTSSHSIAIVLADDRVKVRESGGSYIDYMVGTDFTSGYHTVRISKESGNAWYIWVNGTLLNTDLSTPIVDGNGSFNSGGSWFIGDYSGTGFAGDWAVDYIRLDATDAYAPVYAKADNTENLNLGSSWIDGGAPGSTEVAVWDSTVAGANSVNLGANLSWQGLRIEDPGGDVTIGGANTLTLGSDGLDLGSTANLTYDSSGVLNVNGPFSGSTTLTIDNPFNAKKIWGSSSVDITGTLVLRGSSATIGNWADNWLALNNTSLTQTGSFALDTGASLSDRGEVILTDAWGNGVSRPKLSLSSLSGYGYFRSDWNSTAEADRPRTISVDQSTTTTFNGRIIENNSTTRQIGLEKSGSGTLILYPGGLNTGGYGNSFSGGTIINGGAVQMERADALGAANGTVNVTVKDGTLDLSFDDTGGSYASATTHFTALFNTLTLGGAAGATPTVLTSGTVGSGAALGIANSIVYDASNDPGAATIPGRFITVGTSGISSREIAVGDSAATTTELEISGQMGRTGNGDGEETTIRKTGAGTLKISGQNNFPVLQIEGGKVIASHAQALGVTKVLANSLIMTNGTLEAGDADRSYSTPVTLAANSTNTITGDDHKLTLTGLISGDGALKKTGTDNLALTAANSYTGGTIIDGGMVQISGSGLPGTGEIEINAPGALHVDAGSTKTFSMDISGDGDIIKEGGYQLQLYGSSLDLSGTIYPNNGLIICNPTSGNLTGEPDVYFSSTDAADGIIFGEQFNNKVIALGNLDGSGSENAKIRCDWGANAYRALSINQTVDGEFAGVIEQSSGTRDFALVKTGPAKLVLSGDNTFAQGTTISNGTLQIERADSLGNADGTRNVTVKNGTLDLSYDTSAGAYASATTHFTALYDTLTMGGIAGSNSAVIATGSGGNGQGSALGVDNMIVYDATDNGDTATIAAPWITAGTIATESREVQVGDSSGTTVELDIAGQMSNTGMNDGRSVTVRKTGAGTLRISSTNYFPVVQVEDGTLVVNDALALGTSRTGNGGLANLLSVSNGTVNLNGFSPSVGGLSDSEGATGSILNNGASASTLTVGSSGATTTYSGGIADGAETTALTKTGAGTLTLNGANSYSGTTAINGGTLRIGNGSTTGALGAGPVSIASGSELRFYRSDDFVAAAGAISGDGDVYKQGGGKASLTGNNTYAGTTTVNGGTLEIGSGGTSGTLGSGPVVLTSGNLQFNRSDDFSGSANVISSAGNVIKEGVGKATLTGENSYTGTTTVNDGTLEIGNGGATGDIGSGAVTVDTGAKLLFNRTGTLDYSNGGTPKMRNVSGAGDIELDGGVTIFNYTGSGIGFSEASSWNNFSGTLRVLGGSEFKTIRNGATAMGTATIELGDATTSGHLSQIEGNWTWTNPIDLIGSANEIRNRSTGGPRSLKLQGVIDGSGGLTLTDTTGAMSSDQLGFILTGASTLTGTLTIDAPVRVGGVPGSDASTAAGTGGSLGSADVTINTGEALTFSRTDSHVVNAELDGDGGVFVGLTSGTSGQTVILAADSSVAGTTTIRDGTLQFGNGGTAGSIGDGDIVNDGALAVNRSNALTLDNVISGNGTVTKNAAGTLTLTAESSYSGGTTVADGTLLVNNASGSGTGSGTLTVESGAVLGGTGSIGGVATTESGSTLAPGTSVGTLAFTAGLTLDAGSTLEMEMGASSDLIRVSGGTITGPAAGTVTIDVSNSGGMTKSGVYTLIDWTGASTSSLNVEDFSVTLPAPYEGKVAIAGSKLLLMTSPYSTVFRFK